MELSPVSTASGLVRCASFGEGCSFLVAATGVASRQAFGDVVPDPTPGSFEHEGCPECGDELLGAEERYK